MHTYEKQKRKKKGEKKIKEEEWGKKKSLGGQSLAPYSTESNLQTKGGPRKAPPEGDSKQTNKKMLEVD